MCESRKTARMEIRFLQYELDHRCPNRYLNCHVLHASLAPRLLPNMLLMSHTSYLLTHIILSI